MHLKPGLDPDETVTILGRFVSRYVEDAGADGVVVGLSGGVDSAVTVALCVEALGAEQVACLSMPAETTPERDVRDARNLAEELGVELETVDVQPFVERVGSMCDHDPDAAARGNAMARIRMMVLYYHANLRGRLVCGTGNKSELLVGYFTKHGDGGVDLLPLGDLYKTQVWRLGEHLGIPDPILEKPPSARLVPDQTDEDDLGLPYEDLDRVLRGLELGYGAEEIVDVTGLDPAVVEDVLRRERSNRHKRSSPMVPKLGARSSGTDWREKIV